MTNCSPHGILEFVSQVPVSLSTVLLFEKEKAIELLDKQSCLGPSLLFLKQLLRIDTTRGIHLNNGFSKNYYAKAVKKHQATSYRSSRPN